jgi:hypothetical protein
MKLYTEEQVKSLLNKMDVIYSLEDLTPIELPSDERILENTIKPLHGLMDKWDQGFLSGANWMRDKIIGGNK